LKYSVAPSVSHSRTSVGAASAIERHCDVSKAGGDCMFDDRFCMKGRQLGRRLEAAMLLIGRQ
jgi:hypothetical protein